MGRWVFFGFWFSFSVELVLGVVGGFVSLIANLSDVAETICGEQGEEVRACSWTETI